jgi:16S rRNA (cytosine967-C5)-methyltransferase
MIPAARVTAAIELVGLTKVSLEEKGAAADVLIRAYFKERRYAGSKDRRDVSEKTYMVIRRWGFLSRISDGDAKRMLIASLALNGETKDHIAAYFTDEKHTMPALSTDDLAFLDQVISGGFAETDHEKLNFSEWMTERLTSRFGDDLSIAMQALNERAPLIIRLARNKEAVLGYLAKKEITYTECALASTGLVLEQQQQIRDWTIYRDGMIEIQDEAAQYAIQLAAIEAGSQVMDYCAGAGGKALAASSVMKNKGQIYALDINHRRLQEIKPRIKRSKSHIIQVIGLPKSSLKREKILADFEGKMDHVLVDVPCSGTGTWRRNPESRWRLDEAELAVYCRTQKEIMNEAWAYVKNGGQMVYMTCSILEDENENQVADFISSHVDAHLNPLDVKSLSKLEGVVQMAPHSHGTDGFFVALMTKKA